VEASLITCQEFAGSAHRFADEEQLSRALH
jgi:hypothetical protein